MGSGQLQELLSVCLVVQCPSIRDTRYTFANLVVHVVVSESLQTQVPPEVGASPVVNCTPNAVCTAVTRKRCGQGTADLLADSRVVLKCLFRMLGGSSQVSLQRTLIRVLPVNGLNFSFVPVG